MRVRHKVLAVVVAWAVVVSGLVGFAPSGSAATIDFYPGSGPNNSVNDFVVLNDGSVVIGGSFTAVAGTSRPYLARLDPDGSLDTSFNANVNGVVHDVDLLEDGSLLIAGNFTQAGGTTRTRVAKLEANGAANGDFKTLSGPNAIVYDAEITVSGGVAIGGSFTSVSGFTRNNLAMLDVEATVDGGFNPNVNGVVREVTLDGSGRVYFGGDFTAVGGTPRGRMDRVLADGTPDTAWVPGVGANDTVFSMVLDDDGTVVVGGAFATIDGASRQGVARLSASGVPTAGFSTGSGFNNVVRDVGLDAEGNILVVGGFVNFDATESIRVARLTPTGALDPSFDIGSGPDSLVLRVAPTVTGQVFIAGAFDEVDGEVSTRIALLDGDGRVAGTSFARPGRTDDVTVTRGDGYLDVSWVAPTDEGSQPVTGYDVKQRLSTAASWSAATGGCARAVTAISTSTTCRITGLTVGQTYLVSVAALSIWGTGAASVSPSAVIVSAPSAPVPASAVPANAAISVSWTPPSSSGGEAISSYSASAVGPTTLSCSTDATALGCTITGLTNGSTYAVSVVVRNAAGLSYTQSLGSVTPNPPPARPGRPYAYTDGLGIVVGYEAGESSAGVVSWTFTAGPDGGFCTVTLPTRSCVISVSDTATPQTVTATAANASGVSAPSNPTYPVLVGVCGGSGNPFRDVDPGIYYAPAASCLFDLGITTSVPNYRPDGQVTRAEMAKFLWVMAGSPAAATSCRFTDTAAIPTWARQGACWMRDTGITRTGQFNPGGTVTRGQMAGFLHRFAGEPEFDSSCGFTDELSIPSWAREGACWMREVEVTRVNPYRALDPVKRGEMAAFLYRLGNALQMWRPVSV